MNNAVFIHNTVNSWEYIKTLHPWTLYIYGGQRSLQAEERCQEGLDQFSSLSEVLTMGISRSKEDRHAHFTLCCEVNQQQEVTWSGLSKIMTQCLEKQGGRQAVIVFDITSLELDTILYILPHLLALKPKELFGLYLVPENYAKKGEGLILQPIQQPRGYVSFLPGLEGARQAHHYIITGFDIGRAQRFIDKYDWGLDRIHGVIGDPCYVSDGDKTAWNSNKAWLEPLNRDYPEQIHRVEAAEPYKVRDFFIQEFAIHSMLDIIPLGPKPMLLGVLLFYLSLNKREQERVRILFDFPTPKINTTRGVSKGYLFNCSELLK